MSLSPGTPPQQDQNWLACVDDRDQFRGKRIVTFCGLVGWYMEWVKLAHQWAMMLAERRIPYLRTVERRQDQDLLHAFATLVSTVDLHTVVVGCDISLLQQKPTRVKIAKTDVFAKAMSRLLALPPEGSRLSVTVDDNDSMAMEFYSLIKAARRKTGLMLKDDISSICFGNDTRYAPLQAADLLAYCGRQKLEHGTDQTYDLITRSTRVQHVCETITV
jgi:hypothetical protein